MDFDNYNNSEILPAVLLGTKGDYRRALYTFDKLVPLNNILYLTKCLNHCYCCIAVEEISLWHRGAIYFTT